MVITEQQGEDVLHKDLVMIHERLLIQTNRKI